MRERKEQLALEMTKTTDRIIEQIRPLLAGHNPATQGAVVAELLAIFLGGHPPGMRQEIYDATVEMAVNMIKLHDPWKGKR
jgi:hypothetical protein